MSSATRLVAKRKRPLCHPERTRISYYAALDTPACAAFFEESRMHLVNATKLNRKSGAAEGSAVAGSQAKL